MTQQDERVVDIHVNKVASVSGKNGAQYEIHADGKALFGSQYDYRFWVDVSKVPAPPMPDASYRCVIQRGPLQAGKDESKDYNYKWYITRWNADDVEPSAPAPAYQPPATSNGGGYQAQAPLDDRINRSVVWKAAVEFHLAPFNATEVDEDAFLGLVTETAARWIFTYEHFLQTGRPVGPLPPVEPQEQEPAPVTDERVQGKPNGWHIAPDSISDTLGQEQFGVMLTTRGITPTTVRNLLGATASEFAKANNLSLKQLFLVIQEKWEATEDLPW